MRPSFAVVAPSERSEGARDAGGPTDPRASACRHTEAERKSRPGSPSVLSKPQVRLLSSVPRAVFGGFPPHGPRWLSVFYPPLWTLTAPGRLVRSYGTAAKESGDANCGAGTDAAPAAARWVCVLHPCAATASRPRLMTPMKRPRTDRPARSIRPPGGCGDKCSRKCDYSPGRARQTAAL